MNAQNTLIGGVVLDIIECMVKPFLIPKPDSSFYLTPSERALSFFPALPVLTGPANYAADKELTKQASDECRKYAGSHPVLTPLYFVLTKYVMDMRLWLHMSHHAIHFKYFVLVLQRLLYMIMLVSFINIV